MPMALPSAVFCSRTDPERKSDPRYSIGAAGWQVHELKLEQNQRLAWLLNLPCIYCFLSLSRCGSKAGYFPGRYLCPRLSPGSRQSHDKPALGKVLGILCLSVTRHTRPPPDWEQEGGTCASAQGCTKAAPWLSHWSCLSAAVPRAGRVPLPVVRCTGACLDHQLEPKVLAS